MPCLLGYPYFYLDRCSLFSSMFCLSDANLTVKRLFQVGFLTSRVLSAFQFPCFPRCNPFCFSAVGEFPLIQELLYLLSCAFPSKCFLYNHCNELTDGCLIFRRNNEDLFSKLLGEAKVIMQKANILQITFISTKNVNFIGYDFSLWIMLII